MWHLRGLVVVVDENFLRRFVGRGNIWREKWSINYNPNDLVRFELESVSELAGFFGVVDWEIAKQEGTVMSKPLSQRAFALERLNCGDYIIQGWYCSAVV